MKFYLKLIGSFVGLAVVIFVGMQVYTSIRYCSDPTEGTLISFGRYIYGNNFYGPLQKSCYSISNYNVGGRQMDSYQFGTNKVTQISVQPPTHIQYVINVLGFGPAVSTPPPKKTCIIPGLISISRGDEGNVSQIATLALEKGLSIKSVFQINYIRPFRIASPGATSGMIFAFIEDNQWANILQQADEQSQQNRDAVMNLKNKPYITNMSVGDIRYMMEDGYIVYNPRISVYMDKMDMNKLIDRSESVHLLGLIEQSGGSIELEVGSGLENEGIQTLKEILPLSVTIRTLNCAGID